MKCYLVRKKRAAREIRDALSEEGDDELNKRSSRICRWTGAGRVPMMTATNIQYDRWPVASRDSRCRWHRAPCCSWAHRIGLIRDKASTPIFTSLRSISRITNPTTS